MSEKNIPTEITPRIREAMQMRRDKFYEELEDFVRYFIESNERLKSLGPLSLQQDEDRIIARIQIFGEE